MQKTGSASPRDAADTAVVRIWERGLLCYLTSSIPPRFNTSTQRFASAASGGDNEKRMVWQQLQCRKEVFPIPQRQIPFGDNDPNRRSCRRAKAASVWVRCRVRLLLRKICHRR